jgi:ADP-heptose:LPS heptosyltransferase
MSKQGLRRTRILLFQTEVPNCISDAADLLLRENCFPNAEILLICSELDREKLEGTGKFDRIHTYSRSGVLKNLRFLRAIIKNFDPDISSAVFSGRPIFRKPKLGFFALSSSHRYVFDARMDGYWLKLRSSSRMFLQDRQAMAKYSEKSEEPKHSLRTLLIETESRKAVEKAIKTIGKPEVVPNARISLFCGHERAREFKGNPALEEIHCYTKKTFWSDFKVLWPLFRSKPDVLVAIFSGRRIFMKQKMLYWLLPARARLAFNEHNDCFYLTRWNALQLLRFDRPRSSVDSLASRRVIQLILKGFLFLPRFAYLLVWVTLMKLLRAYRLEKLLKYASTRPSE